MRAVVSLLFILIFHSGVNAFTLDNKLRDKSMEKRATSLFEIIRCPICSGESLSESGSQIAYDMREAIRKKINDGYTDEEIISELKNSYGNSIITTPPSTYILWFIPLTILLIGCFLIQRYINTNPNYGLNKEIKVQLRRGKQGKLEYFSNN